MADLLTVAEAQDAVNDPVADSSKLAAYNSAVSELLQERFGKVLQETVTETIEPRDGVVELGYWPVSSVVSVVEYSAAGAATTLTAETATVKPAAGWRLGRRRDGTLTRRMVRTTSGRESADWIAGGYLVEVEYVAGRVQAVGQVPERWKRAAGMTLKHAWGAESWNTLTTTEGYDVPAARYPALVLPSAVVQMLEDESDPNRWGAFVG